MKIIPLLLTAVSLAGAQAGLPSRTNGKPMPSQFGLKTEVQVSGITPGGIYSELTPVLAEFSQFKPGSEVWVEVSEGSARRDERGTLLPDAKVLSRPSEMAVMSVTGLQKACTHDGTWTMKILMGTPAGAKCLSSITFDLRRDMRRLDPHAVLIEVAQR